MNTKRKKKRTYRMELQYRKPSFLSLLYVFRKLSVMSHGRCHHCATAIAHIHPHTRYISGFLFCLQTDETGCWIMSDTNFPTAVMLRCWRMWQSDLDFLIFLFWYHKPILFWFLSSFQLFISFVYCWKMCFPMDLLSS